MISGRVNKIHLEVLDGSLKCVVLKSHGIDESNYIELDAEFRTKEYELGMKDLEVKWNEK